MTAINTNPGLSTHQHLGTSCDRSARAFAGLHSAVAAPTQPAANAAGTPSVDSFVPSTQVEPGTFSDQAYISGSLARSAQRHQHIESAKNGGADDQQMASDLEGLFGVKGITSFSLDIDTSHQQQIRAEQYAAHGHDGNGGGDSYDYHDAYRSYEEQALGMSGTITTADGASYKVSFDYRMTQEYAQSRDASVRDIPVADSTAADHNGSSPFADLFAGIAQVSSHSDGDPFANLVTLFDDKNKSTPASILSFALTAMTTLRASLADQKANDGNNQLSKKLSDLLSDHGSVIAPSKVDLTA